MSLFSCVIYCLLHHFIFWSTNFLFLNSVYQNGAGCLNDNVFNLPDVFKAFVQTSQLISNCGTNPSAKIIAPYNTNAVGYVTCPNSAVISFAGNFDGACVNINTPPVGTPVEHNKCYSTKRSYGSILNHLYGVKQHVTDWAWYTRHNLFC